MLQDAGKKEEDLGEEAVVLVANGPRHRGPCLAAAPSITSQPPLSHPCHNLFSTSTENPVLPTLLRSFETTGCRASLLTESYRPQPPLPEQFWHPSGPCSREPATLPNIIAFLQKLNYTNQEFLQTRFLPFLCLPFCIHQWISTCC